jgi:tetraacyldisaccharide 4'-kinase
LIVFKILMYPLALLYGLAIWIRNKLFEWDVLPEQEFDLPVINVGNLMVGGTGKTPHVEYLLRLLRPNYKTATLSRGYGRKSLGYILADEQSIAEEIGDEPMLYATKYKDTLVVVCEKRIYAIPNLIGDHPETDVIIMDDGFQHRSVKAGMNILLSMYDKPFYDDFLLPSGTLREWPSGYQRAHIIIVTKCPADLSESKKKEIIQKINPLPHQKIFFSKMVYLAPVNAFTGEALTDTKNLDALVFSGIANAQPFENYCESIFKSIAPLEFKDHHNFDSVDIDDILHRYAKIEGEKIILCTEKDWMRIRKTELEQQLKNSPLYYLPIEVQLLEGEEEFKELLEKFMKSYSIVDS